MYQQNDPGAGGAGSDYEMITDSVEGAFHIAMPRGWQNHAYLARTPSTLRYIAQSTSTDGATYMFYGDPNLPNFMEPNETINEHTQFPVPDPMLRIQQFAPADQFLTQYVHYRFGQSPDFRITGVGVDPAYDKIVRAIAERSPYRPQITTASVSFAFTHGNIPVHGVVDGSTSRITGMWLAEICGVITPAHPFSFHPLLMHMAESFQIDGEWEKAEQSRSALRAAQNQAAHQETMATIQANTQMMTQGHQQRMQDLHAAGFAQQNHWQQQQAQNEASMASWYKQQAADDAAQQGRVNAIREEHTVVTTPPGEIPAPAAQSYRVDAHHDRYYINQQDGTYVGTDAATEKSDLAEKHGVDPDKFEEAQVVR